MSGLATIMHNLKFHVTGSDLQKSDITRRLERMGVKTYLGHRKENVAGVDVVVYSTAIKENNPELAAARKKGVPLVHRGELLAELTRMKIAVCISGTHGKTTTTSMVSEVLLKGGLSPTTVVGGIIKGKSQAHLGRGEYLVCEVDESDKSFLKIFPAYVVITNIEAEHLDHYKDLAEIKESFLYFARHLPFWGCVFLCADNAGSMEIKDSIYKRVVTYGLSDAANLRADNIRRSNFGSFFNVWYQKKSLGRFTLNLPGKHNISNALAAIGIGLELGIKVTKIKQALEKFTGVHRRIEYLGDTMGARVFDDYGHHPTELAVTLQTLREYFPNKRIISVFQPHRYTRTYHLFDEFAIAFLHADVVVITEIYPAHEIPIPGVNGESLARRISKEQQPVHFIPDFNGIMEFLKKTIRPNDIVVIQGAGNINRIAQRLIKECK